MSEPLAYVVTGAFSNCDKGAAILPFTCTSNLSTKVGGILASTELDKAPVANIPSFVMCQVDLKPCTPLTVASEWQDTGEEYSTINGLDPLLFKSCINCTKGGKISFLTTGQLPLSQLDPTGELEKQINEINEEADKMKEEYELAEEAVGAPGFWESLIPLWGSGRETVNAYQQKKYGWMVFHGVMTAADLAGGFLIKGLFKAGTKGVGKTIGKEALDQLIQGFTKKFATMMAAKQLLVKTAKEAFEQTIKKIGAIDGICLVKACFVEGTEIATEDGVKNIEDIKNGDLVWAHNPKTGETGLKEVVQIIQNDVDATIELLINDEIIETTSPHPFYTKTGWKKAKHLTTEDQVKTKNDDWGLIKSISIIKKRKKVYNFEVKDWHTYFVGTWQWLVHNARACLYAAYKNGEQWAINIMRGIKYNRIVNQEMLELAGEKGVKYFSETWLKEGGKLVARVDGYIPGKAIIERKATNLGEILPSTAKRYIDQLATKYAPGTAIANPAKGTVLTGQQFLQVDTIGNVSQEVLDYAAKKGVTIVESSDEIFKAIGL